MSSWTVAALILSIFQVTSSELLALSVSSSSPGQIDVLWGSAAVSAGASGAAQTSCGVLDAWMLTVTEASGGSPMSVDVEANCNSPVPAIEGQTCQFTLTSNTQWNVEVLEDCNDTQARDPSTASVFVLGQPASTPNIQITDASETSLSLSWSSAGDGDCVFQNWQADWQVYGSGNWMEMENGTGTSLVMTGLQANSVYELRVQQVCTDGQLNSPYAQTSEGLFTLPGTFNVYVGTSSDTRIIELSYGPSRCRIVKDCCGDQFSVCFSGTDRKTATLSRMDVAGGWGQQLWLQCQASSVSEFTATFTEVQAPAPLSLELHEATKNTMKAKYRLGYIIDDVATCDCATLSLELSADGSGVWTQFRGQDDSCTVIGTRDCFLIDVMPDTKYWGRMKMSCDNSSADSDYTYSQDFIITPPGCIWSTHTGQWGQGSMFECADGTYCSENDEACCVAHGGRIRCPASTPFMCHNTMDCADSQDRCCMATEEECNGHGGLRTCEVPAKTPLLTQVESLGPASLTISWEPQEYLIGYSSCQFLEWRVAISQVHMYGEGEWEWVTDCDSGNYDSRTCTIENLLSLTDYNVRVWAQCTVVELSSYPNRTTVAVGTRPIPSVSPSALFCTQLEPLRFYADWWPSNSEDCVFVAWQVDAQLLPRTAGFTADGLYEEAAPGGDWVTKCLLEDRNVLNCWVGDLLANREYKIRVRETCTDPLANSPFFERYQECTTLTMPAFDPTNLTAYDEDLYTFEVSWEPNDPKACIFQYWDIQAKINGTDWPEGDDPAVFGCRSLVRTTTNCTVHVGINSGVAFEWRIREACTVRRLFTNWVYYDGLVHTRLPVPASQPENLTAFSISPSHDIAYTSLNVSWDAHPPGECIFTGWKVDTNIHGQATNWQESAECRANPRVPFTCTITTGLFSNVYYDMRISETCVDPNAAGETLIVYNIARTRPVPAVAPILVSVFATSARSLGVTFVPQAAGQCVFKGYAMQWKLLGETDWQSNEACLSRMSASCSVSGFPFSQSFYTVRMQETCTDPLADSPWVEWPDYIQTWPEPAQVPANFTFVELTAYNATFTFEPGLGLDCTWSSWQAQMLQDIENPLSEWADLTECESQLQFRENVTCSVTGLQSFTEYQVRVRERCTNYIYDSDWGYSDRFFTRMPIQAGLPEDLKLVQDSVTAFFFDVSWTGGAPGQCIFKEWVMEVFQISPEPDSWAIPPLVEYLDAPQTWVRHKCVAGRDAPKCRPGDLPRSLKQNSTYAVRVKESCTDPNADGDFTMLDMNVTTIIALVPAEPPENLTVSNETAYTFLLEFDAGVPNDCYFTGWGVEVRENWTYDANFSNETNYTELNYSLWVPREECKEEEVFPRNRMRCVVPRLRKHSLYDAKVQETCYVGYTLALDSDFSEDLPNRQAETEIPVAALTPFGLYGLEPGPYSFSLQWSAGDPKDCLYMKWLVEIRDANYTGGEWREAIECGRQDRSVTSCTITMLHAGYLGEEAHLRSNTEYEVRVKEACETYTSIYDPWGGSRERAEYLDSPIYYLPSNALPRTLVPVPTLTPTNFVVYEIDHQSFRLSWEAPVSNDCRFRNWTVEIQLAIQCVSGPGYTNCTNVVGESWITPSSCVIKDRSVTSCQVTGIQSYSFYNVQMRERCSDGTAESADATLVAEIWPFLANIPENLTITSPEPFTLNLKWDPGESQECVFSHWDVQVQGRRFGDLVDRFSRESVAEKWYGEILDLENNSADLNWSSTVASCRLEGQRNVAECNVSGLVSNALYDVRIAERCVDSRADSPWVVDRLKATIPAWALTPIGPNVTNVTMTTMDLEWAANEPRDCLFQSWKVEVKPVAIAMDSWIPVPECSLPDRSATSCRIVGLQTYTNYDLRVQETCIHNTSDSPYLLDESSFTTQVGRVVYVGTNPDTNSKTIFFGSQGLNACAYHTKCCQDEFSLCYATDQVDVIRTDLPDAGWGQDLYLSCVDDPVAQDDMKRMVAQPPATLEAVGRTANSISLVWLPFGSGGYMSDCYCSVWNIFLRRQGTEEWLLSPECNNMPFSQSSCTVQELEGNWLFPDTVYEVRVRQTCSFDRLSSPFVEIQVPTLPGCSFSQHSGRDDFFVCADGFESNIFEGGRFDGDGIGCWQRGGRAKCSMNFPYMCASPDSCAKVTSALEGGVRADHCCMTTPCGTRNGGDRECIVRPRPPVDLVVTSSTPDSLTIDWKEQDFTDPTFYPCSFRRWQVDLSHFFFEHWSSEWTAAPECFIEDRRTTLCTVSGLISNAYYYVRIREVCQDDTLNGDYETYPTLAQVNPLPATVVTGLYDVQREPFWILVAWTPGSLNDCVHAGWQVTAAGADSHSFTTDGIDRETSLMNMTGLTDGVTYEVSVYELCVNPLANSEVISFTTSTKPEAAGAPVPTVAAAGPYWLSLEWQAGRKGRCDFMHWDVQARKTGTDMFVSAALCTEQPETATSCNVTETFACYKDKTYTGFFSVCIPGVECPITGIENVTACQIACSLQPACRALRFQAAYGHCWLVDSSYNQLNDDPLHQTTGCARNLGLESLSGYELQVSQRCEDSEADSSFATVLPGLAPNQTTIAPATQPEDVQVKAVVGTTMRLSFTPGVLRDYMPVFHQWSFQVKLNSSEAPSDGPIFCWQYPMVCDQVWHTIPSHCAENTRETPWCDVKVYWSQELYQLRMREECLDPTADSPYIAEPIWVTSGTAIAAEPVENFTAVVEIIDYNISVTFDWDAGECNDCIFTGWELQLRAKGGDWEDFPHCMDSRKDDVNCTISEGIASQTTYDARVRQYCLDPLSKGNWTEEMEMFTTPAIPADAPLVSLLTMGPHEMWFALEPRELRDCIFLGFVGKFQAESRGQVGSDEDTEQSDMQIVNETMLCMPRHREPTQCMLRGLQSNTTYYVEVCEYCRNRAADSCGNATNTTNLLAPDAPWNIHVRRTPEAALISFTSGRESGDCHSAGWAIDYFNETWHQLDVCPRSHGAGMEQQCSVDIAQLYPEQAYRMRVQEICADVNSPVAIFVLPILEVDPLVVFSADIMSNMSNVSNDSEMEDWDILETDLNNSNISNGTWSLAAETMDKAENMSAMANMTEWNGSLLNMETGESGNDTVNDTDNESSMHGHGADVGAGNMLEQYDNESVNESENDPANASGNSSMAANVPSTEEQSVGAQSRSACQDSADCSWIIGDWSSCSSSCGSGTQTRSVLCQSGFIEDCPKPMPETELACSSTESCSWVPSTLSECTATCGAGTQTQSWSCPSGNAADCGSEPTLTEVACYATSGCTWLTLDWGQCSSRCGYGTRERNVTCSGPSQADCDGRARPDSTEICHDTAECSWILGVWGSCSATCGNGFRTREISCSSGVEGDCDTASKPAVAEDCREVAGCQWIISPWSVCSSSCGQGWINRTVSCESGSQADCAQPAPATEEACFESFCNWTVMEWSDCNATCGSGFQVREVLCPAGACDGEGPASVQACVGNSGCTWQLAEWSTCSTSCGSGVKNRSVSCPSEYWEDCGQEPTTFDTCSSYTGCQWQVGNWSQCDGNGCGQRVRAVYCQSGQVQDCQAEAQPANITTCDLEVCLEVTSDSASFDLVLEVNNETSVETVKGSVQEAVADSLNVDTEAVSVELVNNGRRLAAMQTLEFIVEVRKVTKGISEFLAAESSLIAVAQDVEQELASSGIAVAVQMSARPDITSTTSATHASVETVETTTAAPPTATAPITTSEVAEVAVATSAAATGTFSSGSLEALEEASTSEVPGVVKVPTSTASTSQAFQVEQVTLSADEEDANLPQDSALAPVLGISLAALVVCGGCLAWRGRQRQMSAHEQVSTTKGAWASKELTQVHLYPWDYAADKIAGMIWTGNQRVHAEMEEDTQPNISPSPTNCRISSVAQSPNPATSETPSLSASYGSEAGKAVAAAASQVRTACTVVAAAAQMQTNTVGSTGDGDSTRPSSGTSNRSPGEAMPRPVAQVVQAQPVALPRAPSATSAPSAPSIPVPIPVPPRGARSPMRKVNWPEDNAATALRVAAAPKHDVTLAPELSQPSKPSKPSKALVSNAPSSHPSSIPLHLPPPSTTSDTSPSSSPSRPPRSSPVVSVRVTRRSEAMHISESSQPSQPSQPSCLPNLPGIPGVKGGGTSSSSAQVEDRRDSWEPSRTPNSQTPRTDTESPPPRRIPRHLVRAAASSPTSPSGSDATGRRSNSARRVPARPSDCWPPPKPR